MTDPKKLLFKFFEFPALSREEYLELREGLPKDLKEILDEAYMLDKQLDYLKKLARIREKGIPPYISSVYERYIRLVSLILTKLSKYLPSEEYENLKKEVNKFTELLWGSSTRIREVSYTLLIIISALKHFLYVMVYIPLRHIKDKYEKLLMDEYVKEVKKLYGLLPEPSKVLEKAK